MVVVSILPHAEFEVSDHWEDALHFISIRFFIFEFRNGDEIANVTKSIVGYSLFDSDEIADLEEKCLSMIKRASKGKLKADSV